MGYHFLEPPWPDVANEPEDQYRLVPGITKGDERWEAYQAMKTRGQQFAGHPIDPDLFELCDGASATDVLTNLVTPRCTMVISDKLKSILDHFEIFDHRLHPLRIGNGAGGPLRYWLLEWCGDVIEHIDFERSIFSKVEMFHNEPPTEVAIGSFEEYERLRKKLVEEAPKRYWMIRGDSIRFSAGAPPGKDLFDLGAVGAMRHHPIISDQLAGALLDAGITGVQFSKAGHVHSL